MHPYTQEPVLGCDRPSSDRMSNRMIFMRVIYDAILISHCLIVTFLHGDALFTEAPGSGSAVTHLTKAFRIFCANVIKQIYAQLIRCAKL
jgi:hypothetical protein